VTGDWRKLHREELHNVYSTSNIIRVIQSRRMRWSRHLARIGGKRNAVVRQPGGRVPPGKPAPMDSSGSTEGSVVGSCEHGKQPSGSINCWEFLD
jgi:hypothetical protein